MAQNPNAAGKNILFMRVCGDYQTARWQWLRGFVPRSIYPPPPPPTKKQPRASIKRTGLSI